MMIIPYMFVFSVLWLTITVDTRLPQERLNFNVLLDRRQSSSFSYVQVRAQDRILTAHNNYRERHCASLLILDNHMNRIAQNFAEVLAKTGRFEHSHLPQVGENIFMISSTSNLDNFDGRIMIDSDALLDMFDLLIYSRYDRCR
jgi:hypothetical protein